MNSPPERSLSRIRIASTNRRLATASTKSEPYSFRSSADEPPGVLLRHPLSPRPVDEPVEVEKKRARGEPAAGGQEGEDLGVDERSPLDRPLGAESDEPLLPLLVRARGQVRRDPRTPELPRDAVLRVRRDREDDQRVVARGGARRVVGERRRRDDAGCAGLRRENEEA